MGDIPRLTQMPQTAPSPRVRFQPFATPDMVGAVPAAHLQAIANQDEKISQQLTAMVEKLAAEKEDADVRGATAEYRAELDSYLYGENGILMRQGENAAGATIEAQKTAEKLRSEYARRFASGRSQAAWDRVGDQEVSRVVGDAARHEAVQVRKASIDNRLAEIQSHIDIGMRGRDNPETVANAEADIRAPGEVLFNDVLGYKPEKRKQAIEDLVSSMHEANIEGYRKAGLRAEADAYFTAHKDAIDATYARAQEDLLKQGARNDLLLARALEIADAAGTPEAKLKTIDTEFKDAEEHAYVERTWANREAFNERMKRQKEDAEVKSAYDEAVQRWVAGDFMHSVPDTLPYDAKLTAESMKEQILVNGKLTTDWTAYQELVEMAKNDYKKFQALNLEKEYGAKLSRNMMAEVKRWQGGGEDMTDAEWNRRIMTEINDTFNGFVRQRRWSPKDQPGKLNLLRTGVMSQVYEEEVKKGDIERIRKIIGQHTQVGKEDVWGRDPSVLRFEVEEGKFYVPQEESTPRTSAAPGGGWGAFGPSDEAVRQSKTEPAPTPTRRPATVSPKAKLSPDGQRWELLSDDGLFILSLWDLDGNPLQVRNVGK